MRVAGHLPRTWLAEQLHPGPNVELALTSCPALPLLFRLTIESGTQLSEEKPASAELVQRARQQEPNVERAQISMAPATRFQAGLPSFGTEGFVGTSTFVFPRYASTGGDGLCRPSYRIRAASRTQRVALVALADSQDASAIAQRDMSEPESENWNERASAKDEALDRESRLLLMLVGRGGLRGEPMSKDEQTRLQNLVSALERLPSATVDVVWPSRLESLDGTWVLIFSSEVVTNGRFDGSELPISSALRSLVYPFLPRGPIRVKRVEQRYAADDRIVDNAILLNVGAGRIPGEHDAEVIVGNKFSVVSADTVKLTLDALQLRVRGLRGTKMRDLGPRLQVPELLQNRQEDFERGQSPEVRTTYLSNRVRITRSPKGELRIFTRPEL